MSFPYLFFPYSDGVKDITKLVPSLILDAKLPNLGITENSESELAVK